TGCITKSPSSNVGTNSPPMVLKIQTLIANKSPASEMTIFLFSNAQWMDGLYNLVRNRMILTDMFLSLCLFGFKNMEEMTGTYVKQKIMAPTNAKLNVSAIGLNILPSTPLSDKMGMNTMRMIS